MIIKVRYEARIDAYEWLVMQGSKIIESGLSRKSVKHAQIEAEAWLEYAAEVGKI